MQQRNEKDGGDGFLRTAGRAAPGGRASPDGWRVPCPTRSLLRPAGSFVIHDSLHGTPHKKTVRAGDRIAQLVILPVARPEIIEMDALPATERGANGFGSTGR